MVRLLLALAPLVMAADLPPRLDAIANESIAARANLGIQVIDLKTGKPLYSRNASRLFLPASNMKLFSSALALLKYGPDKTFATRVLLDGAGNLILEGSGDPSMSARSYPYRKGPNTLAPLHAIEELAEQVVAHGLTRVPGDIVGDDRALPWDPYPPSWTQDDAQNEDGAPVSALVLNDNMLTLTVHPAAAGALTTYSFHPSLEYFAVDNRAVTTANKNESKIRAVRMPGTRQVVITGAIGEGHAPSTFTIAVDDPALFAALALKDALVRRGVRVDGDAVARHRDVTESFAASTADPLASRTSPSLIELLRVTDKVSQNLHAELMLRFASPDGTREAGLESMRDFLKSLGAGQDDYRIDDGSGLSRNDLVTPSLVARLLTHMYGSEHREQWISLLPVGGEDGTLSNRLCCTSDGTRVHAKTGTLARSVALSGYADSRSHGMLAFSILVNDFSAPSATVRQWVDKMALALTE